MAAVTASSPSPPGSSSIVVQVQEQRITLDLPNGERTTTSEVLSQLTQGPLSEQLQGKQLKLIFSGRVLGPRELISAVVPFGAVVQCAILGEGRDYGLQGRRSHIIRSDSDDSDDTDDDDDVEDGSTREQRAVRAATNRASGIFNNRVRRRMRERYDYSDFVWGFMLGFVVGPLMCFWLLEPAPRLQKLGIILGCTIRTLTYEYRQMNELIDTPLENRGPSSSTPPKVPEVVNSFDVVTGGDLM